MKIRVIFKFLLISLLFFSSFNSFSQTTPTIQIFDSTKVCDGYILWMGEAKCQLIDRKGNILYNIPGNLAAFFINKEKMASHSSGDLIVYNKNLDVIWKRVNKYIHHELTITSNDNIIFLSEEMHQINNIILRFDNISTYDSTGKELFKWSTYEQRRYLLSFMMKDKNIFHFKIKGAPDPDSILIDMAPCLKKNGHGSAPLEFFHMNSIQEIPENKAEKKDSVFRKGNILLSFCNYSKSLSSFIAIVDPVQYKILWYYVQKNRRPMHTPTMLPNGHILIYANSTGHRSALPSIEEIDPLSKQIVWKYSVKLPKIWKCGAFGSCQRLPNGNTLISNCNGYIYEVTLEKKIVWEWFINKPKHVKFMFYRAFLFPKEKLNWLVNEK